METHVESLQQIVERRRSVRLFDRTPVPAAVIEKSVELAVLAPSSSNMQPWEFHWVKSPEPRQKLVEACLSQAAAATAAELVVCVARTQSWRRVRVDVLRKLERLEKDGIRIPPAVWEYYRRTVVWAYTQGYLGLLGAIRRSVLWITGWFKPVIREPMSNQQMKVWAIKSTSLACENFMLSVSAHGFDSCPLEGFDANRVRALLGLPRDARIVMVMAVGKQRPGKEPLPRIREPLSEHFHIV